MTTKLVKCASNHREIIKLGLSDGRRVKFLASMLGGVYDSLRYECHLGNVGSGYTQTHGKSQNPLLPSTLHTGGLPRRGINDKSNRTYFGEGFE